MTGCLNAFFNMSIKVILSKHSLGTINLPAVCRETRQGLWAGPGGAGPGPWTWQQGCGQEVRRKRQQDMETGLGLRCDQENGEARNQ